MSAMPEEFFNYGIIATVQHPEKEDEVLVVHFCGYESEPTNLEYEHLYVELKTDPEFGLIDVDFDLHPAPQHIIDRFKQNSEEGE
jgi:hypothetical protein